MTSQLIKVHLDEDSTRYTGKDFNYLLQQLEVETDENYSLKIVNLIKRLTKFSDEQKSIDNRLSDYAIRMIKTVSSLDIDELTRYSETLSDLFSSPHQQEIDTVCENYIYTSWWINTNKYQPSGDEGQILLQLIRRTEDHARKYGWLIADTLSDEYDFYKELFDDHKQK